MQSRTNDGCRIKRMYAICFLIPRNIDGTAIDRLIVLVYREMDISIRNDSPVFVYRRPVQAFPCGYHHVRTGFIGAVKVNQFTLCTDSRDLVIIQIKLKAEYRAAGTISCQFPLGDAHGCFRNKAVDTPKIGTHLGVGGKLYKP